MRFCLFLLFLTALCLQSLQAQVAGMNAYIRFTAKQISFEEAIGGFETRLDVAIQYDAMIVAPGRRFDLNYINIKGKAALADFLAQSGLTFTQTGRQIILKKQVLPVVKPQYVLSGRVLQKQSAEFLGNAEISVNNSSKVYTSDAGYFSVFLPSDTNFVRVYYPGLDVIYDTLFADRNYFVNYELEQRDEHMPQAEVKASNGNDHSTQNGHTDQYYISKARIKRLPHLLGEPDIVRVMSLYPGVVGGSEGMLGMYIRGGASDQNLVLLDDVPVFNCYHLYGIFSIFNEDAVKSASLMKGSFPAKYGGRLSSVVNVQSKEGNAYRIRGAVSFGILASKVFLEGPIIKNRTTFTLAYRRSYLDFLTRPAARLLFNNDSLQNNVYYFWDFNARITHRFSNRSRLSLSCYTGRDIGGIDEKADYETKDVAISERRRQLSSWGNLIGSIKWNYYLGKRTGLLLKAHITEYDYSFNQSYSLKKEYKLPSSVDINDQTEYRLKNGIQDKEAGVIITHKAGPKLSLTGGGGVALHRFIPGDRTLTSVISGNRTELFFNDPTLTTPEYYGFGEANGVIGGRLYYDLGLRIAGYEVSDAYYYVLPEPRVSMRYQFSKNSWIRAGAMRTRQFFHLLTNLTLGLPSDLWVPSVVRYKPSLSDQFSIGYSYGKKSVQFSSELFYKKLENLLEYKDNAGYVTSGINWEDAVTSGSGEAYGWEFMAEKTKGRLTGWVSYSLMWNWREFQELNKGARFPARYDRRHNIYVAGVYKINDHIDFSLSWTYNSGFAITTPIKKYLSPAPGDPYREIYLYGDRNNTRTRDNHRLDIAFNFEKTWRRAFSRVWSVGFFNVYNRRNPFYVNLGYDKNGNRVLYQISLLPLLPNVSYKINF